MLCVTELWYCLLPLTSSLPHTHPYHLFLILPLSTSPLSPSLPVMPYPAPSGSPNEVEAIPQGPNSIHLSWGPPDFIRQNGPITGYDVMYSGGDISDITHVNTTVYILVGLQPYTTYSIRVAAKTSQGRGPFSTAIEQATLEAGETVIAPLEYVIECNLQASVAPPGEHALLGLA